MEVVKSEWMAYIITWRRKLQQGVAPLPQLASWSNPTSNLPVVTRGQRSWNRPMEGVRVRTACIVCMCGHGNFVKDENLLNGKNSGGLGRTETVCFGMLGLHRKWLWDITSILTKATNKSEIILGWILGQCPINMNTNLNRNIQFCYEARSRFSSLINHHRLHHYCHHCIITNVQFSFTDAVV